MSTAPNTEAQEAANKAVDEASEKAKANLNAEIEKAKVYLAQEIEKQQEAIAKINAQMGEEMNQQGTQSDSEKPTGPTPEQMSSKFGVMAMHDDALKAYLEQYALQFNILNYKAANTCYLDAVSTAKTMGIWEDVKRNIAPFPSNEKHIQIISGNNSQPQSSSSVSTGNNGGTSASPVKQSNPRLKAIKLGVVTAALVGSGVGIALAAEKIFSGITFVPAPTEEVDFGGGTFNPDDVSVEIY